MLCVNTLEGSQANALWDLNFKGHLMDLARGDPLDILGEAGFAIAVNSIMRLDAGLDFFLKGAH